MPHVFYSCVLNPIAVSYARYLLPQGGASLAHSHSRSRSHSHSHSLSLSPMELHLVDPTCLAWSSSISSTAPITSSTKFPNECHGNTVPKPPLPLRVESMKRSSKPASSGLQKDLSRILRTEAAVRGVENKGKSWKHRQLWPKAVLEALDEAIKGYRWQAALKAGPNFNYLFFLYLFFFFW